MRAPILTNGPTGTANIRIARAIHKLTVGEKLSRGDLARVLILVSEQTVASGKTLDLLVRKGSLLPTSNSLRSWSGYRGTGTGDRKQETGASHGEAPVKIREETVPRRTSLVSEKLGVEAECERLEFVGTYVTFY